MTFIYEHDLDILKMYLHIKNEVSKSTLSDVRARTGQTHTHRRDRTHYHVALAGDSL